MNVDCYTIYTILHIYKTVKVAFPFFFSLLCLLMIVFGVMNVKKDSKVDDFLVIVGVAN